MNVYDFDNTIYKGDSSIDFWLFCMRYRPRIVVLLPYQVAMVVLFKFRIIDKDRAKGAFFCFLKMIPDVDERVRSFWNKNQKRIKKWYIKQHRKDDLVISASPYFLLKEICDRIGVTKLIATEVDIKSGYLYSANCYGYEKVRRFYSQYPNERIEEFYSDSMSDDGIASISERAFTVKGTSMYPWKPVSKSWMKNEHWRKDK